MEEDIPTASAVSASGLDIIHSPRAVEMAKSHVGELDANARQPSSNHGVSRKFIFQMANALGLPGQENLLTEHLESLAQNGIRADVTENTGFAVTDSGQEENHSPRLRM